MYEPSEDYKLDRAAKIASILQALQYYEHVRRDHPIAQLRAKTFDIFGKELATWLKARTAKDDANGN